MWLITTATAARTGCVPPPAALAVVELLLVWLLLPPLVWLPCALVSD